MTKIEEGDGKTYWIDVHEYPLPIHIKYAFTIHSEQHELIGVFSKQCGEWGSGSDGLTWHVATNRCDFQFRTKIFGEFPENEAQRQPFYMKKERKYQAELKISEYEAEFQLDGAPYYRCSLQPGDIQ